MNILIPVVAISPLRQRLIDEMDIRRFGPETQRNYIRDVGRFATFLGRSPDTATAEEVRRFQVEQCDLGVPAPTMNAIVSALRFFFTQVLDRPDLARKLVRMRHVRKLPVVLSQDEVARAWEETARAAAHEREIASTYIPVVVGGSKLPFARLWSDAMALALYAEESAKPDAQRLPEMQEAAWPQTRDAILSPAPMNQAVEERMVAWTLSRLEAQTGTSHPLYRNLIGNEDADALAARLVAGTRLFDVAERRRLLQAGPAAVHDSADPLLAYVRDKWVPALLASRKDWDDNVDGVYKRNAALIDQARLATGGGAVAPDATFSPRVAFGAVRGYRWYGTEMPAMSTLGEAFALDHGADPFRLPDRWRAARAQLRMDMPLDFVADVDAVGGNSGSPVVNRAGELVGLCFAINDAGEDNTFANDSTAARSISVSWIAIDTLLRKSYGAGGLIDEMVH
jgi:hypothetical protein